MGEYVPSRPPNLNNILECFGVFGKFFGDF